MAIDKTETHQERETLLTEDLLYYFLNHLGLFYRNILKIGSFFYSEYLLIRSWAYGVNFLVAMGKVFYGQVNHSLGIIKVGFNDFVSCEIGPFFNG